MDLGEYLCNGNPAQQRELWDWLLHWLAYPIQNPGAKMATAILMHGPEGTGKNTFFGAIRRIYGRYGTQFSQVEVESNFNGWASGKLFAIGNEVVSRAELYHIQGRLKSMVTEPEWIINEKMLPARAEQNHCNFVFFSNRIDIAKLDRGDRRYCVIWTPPALDDGFYQEVSAEMRAGGVEALHHHLLHMDLGDFGPHAKPPMTSAKEDLVELGMDSTERFFRDWLAGDIPDLPAVACLSDDLYSAYRTWCQREGVGRSAQKQTLLTAVGKRPGVRKAQERLLRGMEVQKRMVVFVNGNHCGPGDGGSRSAWLGERVEDFAAGLRTFRGDLA
jgi:putative DNA primase/helicase